MDQENLELLKKAITLLSSVRIEDVAPYYLLFGALEQLEEIAETIEIINE